MAQISELIAGVMRSIFLSLGPRTKSPLLTSNVRRNNRRLLDTTLTNGYNKFCAEVAQSVEQRTENPRVPSSILGLGTTNTGRAEVVQW